MLASEAPKRASQRCAGVPHWNAADVGFFQDAARRSRLFFRYGMDPAEHLLLLDRPPVGSPGRAQAPGAARFEASTAPFQVTVVPVLAELRRHVASVWVVEGCAGDPARPPALDVLPGTLATLCVTYGSRVEHAGAIAPSAVCGLFTRTRSYVPWPAIGVVMVAWKPGALRRFVPLPADEIAGVSVRAEVVWGGALSGLEDRVAGAPDAQARGLLVQRFLLEHPAPAGWDPLAAHVAEAIVGAGGNVSVAALAAGVGLSERQLERRFSSPSSVRRRSRSRACTGCRPTPSSRACAECRIPSIARSDAAPGSMPPARSPRLARRNPMNVLTPDELDRIVERHFHAEAAKDIGAVLATYTDDIVFDVAGMPDALHGKPAIAAFYTQLFEDLVTEKVTPLRRWHGPSFVVDDAMFECRATGRPFGLEGRGRRVTFRLTHVFDVKEGRICRETVWLDVGALQRQLA